MTKSIYTFLILFITCNIIAQDNDWQQHVEYRINVRLDSLTNDIVGSCATTYFNNSPDTLDRIYFHLWANAFSSKQTPFAEQVLRLGMSDFYFANEEDLGGYVEIKAKSSSEEKALEIIYEEGQNEIAYIPIPGGLAPGMEIPIIFYYILDVPTYFSRLGRSESLYNLVAWYPKPAVYDQDGWHTMPYLAMGEYYSEFANYDVTLCAKEEYTIAHSGYITERSVNNGYQYINTRLENAHDYAWFVSPEMTVEEEKVYLKNNQIVDVKIYRTDADTTWNHAMKYAKQTLQYMADYMGDYPYSSLSIVQGKDSGLGGAMEYPSIKIIKNVKNTAALEYYIAHEVGHSWFYAALGINERDESYFDEGLTTFLEQKYTEYFHEGNNYYDRILYRSFKSEDKPTLRHIAEGQICRHMHQALDTPVDQLSGINYGLNAYQIGSTLVAHLESLLGSEKVKEMIQSFYKKWKYKHPSYDDFLLHIESESQLDLNGYQDIIKGRAVDMTIEKIVNNKIHFGNNGSPQFAVPLVITYEDGSTERKNVEPYDGLQITTKDSKIKSVILDPDFTSLDINPENNRYPRPGIGIGIFPKLDRSSKKDIYLTPILTAYNSYDGFMLGLSSYNSTFPAKNLKWNITPLYGTSSKSIVGQSWISYDTRPTSNKIRKIQYRLGIKSFSLTNNSNNGGNNLRYLRVDPSISLHHNHGPASSIYSKTTLRQLWIGNETFGGELSGFQQNITRLSYNRYNSDILQPNELEVELEFNKYTAPFEFANNNYLKLSLDYRHGFLFKKSKRFDVRFFAAGFIKNTRRQSSSFNNFLTQGSIALLSQGFTDYSFDDYFLDRQGNSTRAYRQIGFNGGGFKDALGGPNSRIGQSNDFAMAINVKSNLPFGPPKLPLKLFFDSGYARTKSFSQEPLQGEIFYSGGVMLEFVDGLLGVYLPLVASDNINSTYESDDRSFFSKVTFSIDLHRSNPWNLIDDFNF